MSRHTEPPAPLSADLTVVAEALVRRRTVGAAFPAGLRLGDITASEAYAVQAHVAARMGWFPEGPRAWKVGGTDDISAAPLPEVLTAPTHGHTTWTLPAGQDDVLIEAELAFRLASPVAATATLAEALACVGTVCVSVEVIGSRLPDGLASPAPWKLADQGVHAGLVVGPERPFAPCQAFTAGDWLAQTCHIHVRRNDGPALAHEARGNHPAIQAGLHPLHTLPWLARHAAAQRRHRTVEHAGTNEAKPIEGLQAGDLVTAGAWLVTTVHRGDDVEVGFEGLSPVRLQMA